MVLQAIPFDQTLAPCHYDPHQRRQGLFPAPAWICILSEQYVKELEKEEPGPFRGPGSSKLVYVVVLNSRRTNPDQHRA